MVSGTPEVVWMLRLTKSFFNKQFTSKRRPIITVLAILVFLVAVNLIGVYTAMIHNKTIPSEISDLFQSSPISKLILNQPYSKYIVRGYSFTSKNDDLLNIGCENLQIRDTIWVSPKSQIDDDMKLIRRNIYMHVIDDYPIAANFFLDSSSEAEHDILLKKWWRFGGSSVWLEKYQIHYMVSRIIYSPQMLKSDPKISVLRVQVFDKYWEELKNHEIEITHSNGETSKIHYPDILKVPVDPPPEIDSLYMGPEDPRVVVRKFINSQGEVDEEPVIIFNMLSEKIGDKRGMHAFKPFDNDKLVLFKIMGLGPKEREKNWAPFFNEAPIENADLINFIYEAEPLTILKCSFNDGICEVVSKHLGSQKSSKHSSSWGEHNEILTGPLRGGTSMIPIPSKKLPDFLTKNNKKYWLGFPRSHVDLCGCLKVLYRPHLMIISREGSKGIFETEYVSSLLDFNLHVSAWDATESVCQGGRGKSVLIPNSILGFYREREREN